MSFFLYDHKPGTLYFKCIFKRNYVLFLLVVFLFFLLNILTHFILIILTICILFLTLSLLSFFLSPSVYILLNLPMLIGGACASIFLDTHIHTYKHRHAIYHRFSSIQHHHWLIVVKTILIEEFVIWKSLYC